ncbi:MAG: hypothetical protein ACR2GQ_02775 [Gemmatimonadota bacterium]
MTRQRPRAFERVFERDGAALSVALLVAVVCAGCDGAGIGLADVSAGELSCESPVVLGALPPVLYEASGVTRDPRRDDLFWAHNDSGNPAELFAVDSLGRVLAVVPVSGATDRDIEDIATGPCPEGDCLYLGDIGDNFAVRGSVTIHRLPLPPLPAPEAGASAGAKAGTGAGARAGVGADAPALAPSAPIAPSASWTLVYSDGARDAESLAIDGKSNEILVVTKGREGIVELHVARIDRLHAGGGEPDTLRRVGSLAVPIGNNTAQYITAADLSPDGERLAVRSYTTLYEFAWPRNEGAGVFDTLQAPSHAPLIGALEAQGEGLAWDASGESLVLVSEGRGDRPPTISRIRCAPGSAAQAPATTPAQAPAKAPATTPARAPAKDRPSLTAGESS